MSEKDSVRIFFRHATALVVTLGITFVYIQLIPVNNTTVALTFLMAILGIAAAWELSEAVVASVASMLCFNFFFLPPVGSFTIADPQNWVALSAFLVTAIVASQLSARARKRAIDAMRREREIERLYELSRNLMFVDNNSAPAGQISYWIVQVFQVPGAAIFDRYTNETYRTGECDLPISDGKLRDAAIQNTSHRNSVTNLSVLPFSLGDEPLGSLAIYGGSISDAAIQAISNLVAIARERARSAELASHLEAARRSEEMRSTLLDALAHEFTKPLASIRAAASSVLSEDDAVQKELVTMIESEADRLSALVRETIRTALV